MSVRDDLAGAKARQTLGPLERCGCRKPDPLAEILALSDAERDGWDAKIAALRDSGLAVAMADWPSVLPAGAAQGSVLVSKDATGSPLWNPLVGLGIQLDVGGDSRISEFGPSTADQGIAQKVAWLLGIPSVRICALGGAYHSYQDVGNGALGDGGWAHIANEFNRQEQSGSRYNSTVTQTQAAGVASTTVTSLTNGAAPVAGEWVTLGKGAQTENIQISSTWNGASPITFATNTTQAHTSGDPIYHACRNNGYLAKSSLVILSAEGINDLGNTGPGAPPSPLSNTWQSGTFGTTLGASVGHGPLMHSVRFTLAQLRCSVIYADLHPSIAFAGTWTSQPQTSSASYPAGITPFNGFSNGNWHFATANGSTATFSTAPDFPGGVVDVFCLVGSSGQGAIWDWSINGGASTAHAAGSVYDTRNISNIFMNNPSVNGSVPGTVLRIPGLSPGVNTIVITATTVSSFAGFLGWGPEAPIPPLIVALTAARNGNGFRVTGNGYGPRAVGAITGATVAAGHGAAAGEVSFVGGTLPLGTIGTVSGTAAQLNDTITVGGPASLGRLGSTSSVSVPGGGLSITSASAVATGNTVIVTAFIGNNTHPPTSCTDSKGNTYTLDAIQTVTSPTNGSVAIYSAPVTVALTNTDTVTVVFGAGGAPGGITVDAFSGLLSAGRVDVTGSGSAASGTGALSMPSTGLTAGDRDLVVGAFMFSANVTFTPGTGFVNPGTVNIALNQGGVMEYNNVGPATQQYAVATGSQSSTTAWIGVLVAYKQTYNYETRRIVGYTGSPATACQVDANFVNAHTAEPVLIGMQEADYVGGGYTNVADTQGALSVPGVLGAVNSVVGEFDSSVIAVSMDAALMPPGPGTVVDSSNYYPDWVHFNDKGSGPIAAAIGQAVIAHQSSFPSIASATVPNKRTFLAVYGDAGATPATSSVNMAFQSGWSNAFLTDTTYHKTGLYKDFPNSREVFLELAITGGTDGTIITVPPGFRPAAKRLIPAVGPGGPAALVVLPNGNVSFWYGYPGTSGVVAAAGSWVAEL